MKAKASLPRRERKPTPAEVAKARKFVSGPRGPLGPQHKLMKRIRARVGAAAQEVTELRNSLGVVPDPGSGWNPATDLAWQLDKAFDALDIAIKCPSTQPGRSRSIRNPSRPNARERPHRRRPHRAGPGLSHQFGL